MIWEGDEQAILSILGLLAETGSASGTVPEWRRYLYAGTRESQERERRVDEADRDPFAIYGERRMEGRAGRADTTRED